MRFIMMIFFFQFFLRINVFFFNKVKFDQLNYFICMKHFCVESVPYIICVRSTYDMWGYDLTMIHPMIHPPSHSLLNFRRM